jgi:hypothetical protein
MAVILSLPNEPNTIKNIRLWQRLFDLGKVIVPSTAYTHKAYLTAPQDLFNLFGSDGHTIEALQQQHKVSIEINNRKKVSKIVVTIFTKENYNNITDAQTAIQAICPSLTSAPEEERS